MPSIKILHHKLAESNDDENKFSMTFANVLNKVLGSTYKNSDSVSLVLELEDMNIDNISTTFVGCVINSAIMPSIHSVCKNEGFSNATVKHFGNFLILLEFEYFWVLDRLQCYEIINSWLLMLSSWSYNFSIIDLVAWINVEGVLIKS